MTKLVLYIDGSGVRGKFPDDKHKTKKKYKNVNGWSLIACANGETVELSGAVDIREHENGTHEFFAFVECIKYAKSKGCEFRDLSIYTDDAVISHIGHSLHKENFAKSHIMNLDKWKNICHRYYDYSVYEDVIKCILEARINKVKGHARCVYNIRADYLAKHAAQVHLFGAKHREPLMSFENQLRKGIVEHGDDGKISRWYPPFIKTVSDVLGIEPEDMSIDTKSLVAQQEALSESFGLS